MSRLKRDGTAELNSQDQTLRREWGQGKSYFPCSADHEQDWQPYPVGAQSAESDDLTHTHYRKLFVSRAFAMFSFVALVIAVWS